MNTYIKILFIGVFLYFIYTYLNNKKENFDINNILTQFAQNPNAQVSISGTTITNQNIPTTLFGFNLPQFSIPQPSTIQTEQSSTIQTVENIPTSSTIQTVQPFTNEEEQENNIPEIELTKEQKIDKLTKEYFDAENEILKKIKASRDRRERKLLNEQIEELYAKLKKNIDEI